MKAIALAFSFFAAMKTMWLLVAFSDAFVPSQRSHSVKFSGGDLVSFSRSFSRSGSHQLYLFGRKKEPAVAKKKADHVSSSFLNFLNRSKEPKRDTVPAAALVAPLSPAEEAAALRRAAVQARLEAELMEAELTLRKLQRLESELEASASNTSDSRSERKPASRSPEDMRREMDALLSKVRGEPIPRNSTATESSPGSSTSSDSITASSVANHAIPESSTAIKAVWPKYIVPFDEKTFEELEKNLKLLPQFVQAAVALTVDLKTETDPETGKAVLNTTEFVSRMDMARRFDFSYSSKPPPTFTQQQIADSKALMKTTVASEPLTNPWGIAGGLFNENLMETLEQTLRKDERFADLDVDDTTLAVLLLECQYYLDSGDSEANAKQTAEQVMSMMLDEPWLKPFVRNGTLPTAMDAVIVSLYPKCTTRMDMEEENALIPTEAQVQQLIADVLPKANFKTSAKPQAVLGGYIVRGATADDGDTFIANVDAALARSNLRDKLTVLYARDDFSVMAPDFEAAALSDDDPPFLYVVAPNICRDPKPFQLSVVSALGLATTWYLSVYPFLLNPAIAARVDEQLAIAEANMVPDLAWLTDLSVPLFATFMGVQLIHEIGHLVVAEANGVRPCLRVLSTR